MKRVAVITGIAGLVALIAFGIFLATFDADRYRPLVVAQLESALGRPVRLQHLSLGWRGGLALHVTGVEVFGDPAGAEPIATAERVSATVPLLPLLRRELRATSVEVRDGQVRLRGLHPALPLDLSVTDLDVTLNDVSLTRPIAFHAEAAVLSDTQNVRLQGRFHPPSPAQPALLEDLQLHAEVRLEALWPPPGSDQPRLRGTLTSSFGGRAQGLAWPQVSRSLSGQGRLTLTDARIDNLNILREVLRRLSMLPGVLEALQAKLPPSYQARLEARDTLLHPVELQVTAADGTLTFAELQLDTDDLILKGAGHIGLDGALTAQASVWVDPDLSAAIIRSVSELRSLADAQGRLELPVVVQGMLPRVAVLPDLGQIGSRLVIRRAQDALGGLLQRALEKHLAPEPGTPPTSSP